MKNTNKTVVPVVEYEGRYFSGSKIFLFKHLIERMPYVGHDYTLLIDDSSVQYDCTEIWVFETLGSFYEYNDARYEGAWRPVFQRVNEYKKARIEIKFKGGRYYAAVDLFSYPDEMLRSPKKLSADHVIDGAEIFVFDTLDTLDDFFDSLYDNDGGWLPIVLAGWYDSEMCGRYSRP